MIPEKKKTYLLLAILSILAISLIFIVSMKGKDKTANYNEHLFSVEDPAQVDEIIISDPKLKINKFQKLAGNNWTLNDSIPVDANMSDLLLKVLSRIEIKKSFSAQSAPERIEKLKQEGFKVEVYSGKILSSSFFLDVYPGNKAYSYANIVGSETPYLVHIPGFENNIADVFGLKYWDWKDRIVFNSNARTILSVDIRYPAQEKNNVNIIYENNFFKVPGISNIDSAKILNYINNFNEFRIGAYLNEKEDLIVDSLKISPIFCTIQINDIDTTRSDLVDFFAFDQNQPLIYGRSQRKSSYFLIPKTYMKKLFVNKSDFAK